MTRVDNRPRVHLWPHEDGVQWSFGPCATPRAGADHGDALNRAIAELGARADKGVVVIVEARL